MDSRFGYDCQASHKWAIFELDSQADPTSPNYDDGLEQTGGVVGSSEWIWLEENTARRIVAALTYFYNMPTDELVKFVEETPELFKELKSGRG